MEKTVSEEGTTLTFNILFIINCFVLLTSISLQCSRKQAVIYIDYQRKTSLIAEVMKEQCQIGTITATGLTPLFIKSPVIDKEYRMIKKGEQSSIYQGTTICLYVDSKVGAQLYVAQATTQPQAISNSISVERANSSKSPENERKTCTKSDNLTEKQANEEMNLIKSISSSKTIQRLLHYCSTAYHQMEKKPIPTLALPSSLHSHQQQGIAWLVTLYQHGYNGILADEMGMGKTIQVLFFLQYLYKHTNHHKPLYLIIVPSSLLYNWEKEIIQWVPNMKCIVLTGSVEEKELKIKEFLEKRDTISILLTSYSLFEREPMHSIRNLLYQEHFDVCILDEGHSIKNNTSKRYSRLMKLKCTRKYLLTGTPIQNTIHELFALLAFLHPEKANELFTTAKELQKKSNQSNHEKIISIIQKILNPFILRRVKKDMPIELPDKIEYIKKVEMKTYQQSLYDEYIRRYDEQKKGDYDLVHLYMDLRKIANHPLLLRSFYSHSKLLKICKLLNQNQSTSLDDLENMTDFDIHSLITSHMDTIPALSNYLLTNTQLFSSTKITYLIDLLYSLLENHHRVLIFSQWITILDIIALVLYSKGLDYYRIDGSTSLEERQSQVDAFNSNTENIDIFLLTTRSGGLGFNLIGADTVIIHDSDYNPTFDRQAEDRCHRIGQRKKVSVYKLIAKGTVDERIFEISQRKAELGDTILDNQTTEKEFFQEVIKTTVNLIQ